MSEIDSSKQPSAVLLRYGLAVLSAGLALLLTRLLGHSMDASPAPLFFAAVIITAWYGGMGPGLFAIALSTFAIDYFLITPDEAFAITLVDVPRVAAFVLSAFLISSLTAARKRAEDALRQAHDKLEVKVEQRTTELAQANRALQAEIAERNLAEREREQLLEGLKTERALLEAVLRQMPAGVVIAEAPSSKVILGNKQVEQILRHTFSLTGEVERYEAYACYSADGRAYKPEEMPLARSTLTGEVVNDEEIHFARGDGSIGIVLLSSCPIRDRDGKIIAGVAVFHDITEQKRAQEALIESQERYRELFENASDVVYTLDLSGNITSLNKACERITGYAREELLGKPLAQFVTPAHLEMMRGMMQRKLEGDALTNYELEIVAKDKRTLILEVSSRLIYKQDKPVGVQGIARDVTIRKLAEEAIRLSERQYRTLADAVPQLVWVNNAEGMKEYFNARWQQYTGTPPEEHMEMKWLSVIHSDDLPTVLEVRAKGVELGESYEFECRMRRADGAYRWHIARALPMKSDGGEILQWFGTATDIHDIKRAEESNRFLAEAGSLLASSLDEEVTVKSMAHVVVPYLADWCVVDLLEADGSVERFAGRHSDPSKERWLADLLQHYDYNYSKDAQYCVPEVLRTGKPEIVNEVAEEWLEAVAYSSEHFRILRELGLGSYMVVPLVTRGRTLGAISFSSVKPNRYSESDLVLAQDLAHRAALAIDNARLYQEAQEASRVKDEFLAMVSHELRTPLNAILGWAEIMRTGRLDESAKERALETIVRNGKSQAQLIEDMLDVSRIITGKLRLDVRPVGLVSVINAAVDAVRPASFAKDIAFQVSLDASVGSVPGDSNRLQQVIWNLISNAIKFTPPKGAVEVKLEQSDSYAQIVVSDTGAGIKAEFLPHVFDRFRQADSSYTRRHGGLGLGLAIVRHLVEMHGGTVRAESDGEGKGATFIVRLPLLKDEGRAMRGDLRRDTSLDYTDPSSLISQTSLDGLRLLVVDDEPDARELISAVLEQYGATVMAVASAAEALNLLAGCEPGRRPDVILSDIGMPGEDGLFLIKQVRAMAQGAGANIPAIAVTAYARAEDRARALRAGYQIHIAKPFEPVDLVTAVAGLVREGTKGFAN